MLKLQGKLPCNVCLNNDKECSYKEHVDHPQEAVMNALELPRSSGTTATSTAPAECLAIEAANQVDPEPEWPHYLVITVG